MYNIGTHVYQNGTKFVPDWYQIGTGLVAHVYNIGTRFVPDLYYICIKLVPDSYQIGTRFVPDWYQIRTRFVRNCAVTDTAAAAISFEAKFKSTGPHRRSLTNPRVRTGSPLQIHESAQAVSYDLDMATKDANP